MMYMYDLLNTNNGTTTNEFLEFLKEFFSLKFHVLPWYGYLISSFSSIFCIVFSGLMAGLTLGLLSFDKMTLEILKTTGTRKEKSRATKIQKLVKHHHWLLVSLLISNSVAMEALPLFLDQMLPSLLSVFISVSFILLFGEVLPQAICSRYALIVGSYSYYVVYFLMILTFPISFPIAKLLDCLLGKNHYTFFRRAQLKELVSLHRGDHEENEKVKEGEEKDYGTIENVDKNVKDKNLKKKKKKIVDKGPLNIDEITVIRGALELSTKTVKDVMTKLEKVFMLEINEILNKETMTKIIKSGHSRVPIYSTNKQNIKGLLLVKNLILLDPKENVPISDIPLRPIPCVQDDYKIWDILNIFQEGKSHLNVVFRKPDSTKYYSDISDIGKREYIGILTLEDVIEELIQEEIIDETDVYVDINQHVTIANLCREISFSAFKAQKGKTSLTQIGLEGISNMNPNQNLLQICDNSPSNSIKKRKDKKSSDEKSPLLGKKEIISEKKI